MDLERWDDTIFDNIDLQQAATSMETANSSGEYIYYLQCMYSMYL